jgi:NAD(P)H-dependent flavin oxidoreductase YrpB (nitropropane dioxygenase family)
VRTRITELLRIEHPIIQASMAWITDAELAAAVSEAGGLGTIGPNAGSRAVTTDVVETGERLREQIGKCRELTDEPFAVNFVVGVTGRDRDFSDRCVEVGIEEQVPIAVVSQGNPAVYTAKLRNAGIKVIHVCSTVRHVRKAEAAGADAVIVSVDAVEIPVIAGGGIVDARGLMGTLALGAEGVYMGTRFMATKECPTHPNVKRALVEATDTSTMAIRHGSPAPVQDESRGDRGFVEERRGSLRMLLNDFAIGMLAERGGGITLEEALNTPGASEESPESNRTVSAFVFGDLKNNAITAGQGSGMIDDIPSCRELIQRLIGEAEPILERLNAIASSPVA